MTRRVVNLFAGAGGWEVAAQRLGVDPIGLEWDAAACATRKAAGFQTVRCDVARYPLDQFAPLWGLIGSPPCPDFSKAGKRAGLRSERGQLVWQPLYWCERLMPEWVALEQVPEVLPIWRAIAERLRALGYSAWCGLLKAERFGVPQTRTRAILIAHRSRIVAPPEPSHQEYVKGVPQAPIAMRTCSVKDYRRGCRWPTP